MKKLILLISLLAGMTSCYKEEALIIPDQPDKYNILNDDPSNPTKHFIYQFYQKYQTVIITNPTEADYKFNFTASNGIKITPPEQSQKVMDDGIIFLRKALLDLYSDDFLKKNLPFSIILAEQIQLSAYGETGIKNCFASRSFIALGNVAVGVNDMPESDFLKIRADVNASFWSTYMSQIRGLFHVPETFYEASKAVQPKIYDFYYMGSKDPKTMDFYSFGLITYNTESSYIDEANEMFSVYAPSKEMDLIQWMNFVFEKTPAEIQEICAKYPVMNQKYDTIREAMLANGFDLSKLKL